MFSILRIILKTSEETVGNCCTGEVHGRDGLVLISADDEYDLKREVIPKSAWM